MRGGADRCRVRLLTGPIRLSVGRRHGYRASNPGRLPGEDYDMERLAAFEDEVRHLLAVGRYAKWAGQLSDAGLAAPTFGDVPPAEAALMAEAVRAEAESRAAPPGLWRRRWRRG